MKLMVGALLAPDPNWITNAAAHSIDATLPRTTQIEATLTLRRGGRRMAHGRRDINHLVDVPGRAADQHGLHDH
jgi:hypothetical protein